MKKISRLILPLILMNGIVGCSSNQIEFISMEFFADEGQPIVWRGSVLQNMINNFFYCIYFC